MTTDQQQPQAEQIAYLPWYEAGGPNECEHGYAEGIPCPHCDQNPKLQALVATVARQAETIERLERRAPPDDWVEITEAPSGPFEGEHVPSGERKVCMSKASFDASSVVLSAASRVNLIATTDFRVSDRSERRRMKKDLSDALKTLTAALAALAALEAGQ